MQILLGGVSSERQYVKSLTSFHQIQTREGDKRLVMDGGVGIHARRSLGMVFEQYPDLDAIMLCDLDMLFPPDTLEKLRTHLERDDVDIVSGHYFRRHTDPMQSVAKEDRGGWPFVPWLDVPSEGMHRVGSTGMGCILISREAYLAVQEHLGEHPFNDGPLEGYVADTGGFGQDVRFCVVAGMLDLNVWVDASIECPHGHTVWLTKYLYDKLGHRDLQGPFWKNLIDDSRRDTEMDAKTATLRLEQLQMARNEIATDLEEAERQTDDLATQVDELTDRLKVLDGQIAEREIDMQEQQPASGSRPFRKTNMADRVYGSKEELQDAVNRKKMVPTMPEGKLEDKIALREEKYREESEARLDVLDE